ncbi:hypothetical protein [Lentzea indica]|uniref:hypothetical protein n=1 Tax=Lentzea indica TaxID=2604800 RepID=UPI00143B4103|nr:hypothetical protein [Lentzea indica]
MALIEKKCSVCGKFSWDSDFGPYHERHENKKGVSEPCDTNGGTYVDGERQ